jgi:formate-dependent phosphoribosylglycinamide formyltransferase (GAR transformylase)
MEPYCVIVDGYSSGKFYVQEFNRLGYRCLHIKSRETIPAFLVGCFCTSSYHAATTHTSMEETLRWINSYGIPRFIVAGSEPGVNLADSLSNAFHLESANALNLTEARRDKYLMMETVRAAGVRAIRQFRTASADAALTWIEAAGLSYPVVVKPLNSVAGEGFSLCKSTKDVYAAFGKILGKQNLLNIANDAALVQEFIAGEEYVVDTVSRDGKHMVSDFLKYGKSFTVEGCNIYKSCSFLPGDFALAEVLERYVVSVLNALGVGNGPAHVEIMIDKNGPVLIEVGARLAGCSLDPELIGMVYGHSQVSLSVMAYHDPQAFKAVCLRAEKPFHQHLEFVFLSSETDGVVDKISDGPIRALRSFRKIDFNVREGSKTTRTRNLTEAAAIVYLMHEDSRVIEEDRQAIFAIEPEIIQMRSPECAVPV